MRILYIGPSQPAYHDAFIAALKQKGEVDYFPFFVEKPYTRNISKLGLYPKKEVAEKEYYARLLTYKNYDFILVRHGFQLDNGIYTALKSNNNNAKFINFHWDSLKNSYNYLGIINHFDKIYSFDVKDCQEHRRIEYLPLFYIDQYKALKNSSSTNIQSTDLLFVGSWRNMERYQLILKTKQFCDNNRLRFKYYLHIDKFKYVNALLKGKFIKEVQFKLLSHEEIVRLFSDTKVIIDFPSSFQNGLTMRSFEALGAGKKLITTNKNIINEPFYDQSVVSVVSQDNLKLDIDFITNTVFPNDFPNLDAYSLHNYIARLLS